MNIYKVSIVIPIHASMKNGDFFLWRLIQSIMSQTFKDYEIVIVQEGTMPVNTNAGIKKAKGELVKIMYMDDYFAHDTALQEIVDNFKDEDRWLVTGCLHQKVRGDIGQPHYPELTEDLSTGNNRIGSPSVLTLRNEGHLLFDENLSWLLDCDLYERYYRKYGAPKIVNDLSVIIGVGDHQMTVLLSDEQKHKEHIYLKNKYG